MKENFRFEGQHETITPQLVIDRTQLDRNTDHAIDMIGDVSRLWPHVKSHKMAAIVSRLMAKGIDKFKCATIAELEMVARAGASKALLAYPLVGVNIPRFLALQKAFPDTEVLALTDDVQQMHLMEEECRKTGEHISLLCDVNVGMNRTGILPDRIDSFFAESSKLDHVSLVGFHCYDGHRHEKELAQRKSHTDLTYAMIKEKIATLKQNGFDIRYLIMGGSPTFPCYAPYEDVYCSPGTIFINDAGYSASYADLDFPPAAAILTRVISNPAPGAFTLDLGYKGIASDPAGSRGVIVGLDNVEQQFQSEEHWAWRMKSGHEDECPVVGDELFVIPTHICPTSALYPYAIVIENGRIVDRYETTARNRKITF